MSNLRTLRRNKMAETEKALEAAKKNGHPEIVANEDRGLFNELVRLQNAAALLADLTERHRQAAEGLRLKLLPKYGIDIGRGDHIADNWTIRRGGVKADA